MSERMLTGARRVVLSALAASLCLAIAHAGAGRRRSQKIGNHDAREPVLPALRRHAPGEQKFTVQRHHVEGRERRNQLLLRSGRSRNARRRSRTVPGTSEFSVEISSSPNSPNNPCVLRAVPEGDDDALPARRALVLQRPGDRALGLDRPDKRRRQQRSCSTTASKTGRSRARSRSSRPALAA